MEKNALLADFCREHKIEFKQYVPLREHCTFKIGGPARMFLRPASREQISALLRFTRECRIPTLILGKGSNVLFSDKGFDGAVICLGGYYSGMHRMRDTEIWCESGASLAQLCRFALEEGLSGLEFAYGIPGTVGGAVYMNAGAYGGEMKDVLLRTEHLSPDGAAGEFVDGEMELSYRHSAYSGTNFVITAAALGLKRDDKESIRGRMEDYMRRRREKQPLEYPSAGSTFKRPEGAYASALIDQCGLKGKRVGDAMVSEKHAGFVVNCGNATCADVLALMELVREEVERQTGHRLVSEVKIIGD